MSKQLFKLEPKINILLEIIKCFGIDNLNEEKTFSRDILIKIDSVNKIKQLHLKKYYLPCKSKIYLNNLNEKKIITILRHFLKFFNYTLKSKEKYINKKKIIIYRIENNEINNTIILEDKKTVYF